MAVRQDENPKRPLKVSLSMALDTQTKLRAKIESQSSMSSSVYPVVDGKVQDIVPRQHFEPFKREFRTIVNDGIRYKGWMVPGLSSSTEAATFHVHRACPSQ